jgi:hypothetical protein
MKWVMFFAAILTAIMILTPLTRQHMKTTHKRDILLAVAVGFFTAAVLMAAALLIAAKCIEYANN